MNFYKRRKQLLELKERNNQIFEKDKARNWARDHRIEVYKKYGNACVFCGLKNSMKERLHIHHIRYTKNINDLILLCRKCHVEEHRRLKNDL